MAIQIDRCTRVKARIVLCVASLALTMMNAPLRASCDQIRILNAVDAAAEVVRSNRLNGGFEHEWARIHNSLVKGGWAKPYHDGGPGLAMTDSEVVPMGVMSVCGGDNVSDDISEMPGVLASRVFEAEGDNVSAENAEYRALQAPKGRAHYHFPQDHLTAA